MTGTTRARTWTVLLVLLLALALTGCSPFPGIEIGNAGTEPVVVDLLHEYPIRDVPSYVGGQRFEVRGVLQLWDFDRLMEDGACMQSRSGGQLTLTLSTLSNELLFTRNLDEQPVCDGERYVWTGDDLVQLEPGDDWPPLLDPDEIGQVSFEPE